jgi:hypothetical protein
VAGSKRRPYRAGRRHSRVRRLLNDITIDAEHSNLVKPKAVEKAQMVMDWEPMCRHAERNWKSQRKTQYKQ